MSLVCSFVLSLSLFFAVRQNESHCKITDWEVCAKHSIFLHLNKILNDRFLSIGDRHRYLIVWLHHALSHSTSFFMQLKEMNFSLLMLLNMSIHHKVFWFSNTYKRSLPICKLALLQLIGETFLSAVVAHNTSQPNTIDAHFLQTIR